LIIPKKKQNEPQEVEISNRNDFQIINNNNNNNNNNYNNNIGEKKQQGEIEINVIDSDSKKSNNQRDNESGFPPSNSIDDGFEFDAKSRASVRPVENYDNSARKLNEDTNISENQKSNIDLNLNK